MLLKQNISLNMRDICVGPHTGGDARDATESINTANFSSFTQSYSNSCTVRLSK